MTRKEEREFKASARGIVFRDDLIIDGVDKKIAEIYSVIAQSKFKEGAEWADKTMVDKACKWLSNNKDHPFIGCEDHQLAGYLTDEFIEDFRKAMLEEE